MGKNKEENRREIEIKELKRSNKIARLTTIIAVAGLLLSAIIGGVQLRLDFMRYQDEKKTDYTNNQIISEDINEKE